MPKIVNDGPLPNRQDARPPPSNPPAMGIWLQTSLAAAALAGIATLYGSPQVKPKQTATPTHKRVGITAVRTLIGCPSDAADAVLTVKKSPEGYNFGHVQTSNTAYHGSGFPSYIVDVVIPPDYVPPYGTIKIYAGSANASEFYRDETKCQAQKLSWTVFKRVPRPITQTYTHPIVVNELKQATWVLDADLGEYCDSGVSYRIEVPTPEAAAGQATVYRVIVLPKSNGAPAPARVSWQWDY